MRKIKTKGLKFKTRHVDKGPRFAIALHSVKSPDKTKLALTNVFDINDALADQVVSATPVVICRDLDQDVATKYVQQLKCPGSDFRVWLESAAGKMRQMNLKQKQGSAPMAAPHIRKH